MNLQPLPPAPRQRGERGSAAEGINFSARTMIASNYRRHADALIAQMELDLSGRVDADAQSRAAWWSWLMEAGTPQATPKAVAPRWWATARRAAARLAKAVKTACKTIFEAMAGM